MLSAGRGKTVVKSRQALVALFIAALLVATGCTPPHSASISTAEPTSTPQPKPLIQATEIEPAPSSTPHPTLEAEPATAFLPTPPPPPADPFDLISRQSLFTYLEGLTAIQPYSGWRNSASEGEAEALDYVKSKLSKLTALQDSGMSVERQAFGAFLGTELRETDLYLTVGGQEIEVPADGLRGPRDDNSRALRFDSDGTLNDSAPNPVVAGGPVVLIRTAEEIQGLGRADLQGKVVLLDYKLIDLVVQDGPQSAVESARVLSEKGPAGLVLVTSFSNEVGESHGSFVGDSSVLNGAAIQTVPPTLYVRLEDLAPAGIAGWDDLARVEAARLIWDADVFSPAPSGNLIAHIPGVDPSQATILGAHIDSANSPGALDDGSGCAILLEVARVLNGSHTAPPNDLYLVWFGSEELGLLGSAHFADTHQALLERARGMLQIDMLSYPLDGIDAFLVLLGSSRNQAGDDQRSWLDRLAREAGERGPTVMPVVTDAVSSDNGSFDRFGVPNADLVYMNEQEMEATGSFHYAAHIHDPYDTIDLARKVGDVLEEMARVALVAALDPLPGAPIPANDLPAAP
jgi:hypothetical protein